MSLASVLQGEHTALNTVDKNVSALEPGVNGPGTVEGRLATGGVILGVNIKKAQLLELGTSGVGGDGGNVDNAQTRAVIGLVGDAVHDILVVVDGLDGALVQAAELGLGQVRNVDNVGGGVLVSGGAVLVALILFVVQQQVLHVLVGNPALVGIRGTLVGGARNLLGAGAVRNVDNSESVLVVVEADLTALVLFVRAGVNNTLSVVHIAVVADAASLCRVARVRDIKHPEAGVAPVIVLSADRKDGVGGFMSNDVVAATEFVVECSQVFGDAEGLWLLRVEVQKLGEVKDLQTVVLRLRADVNVMSDDLHVAPVRVLRLGRKTANVLQVAVSENLNKSSTVSLADNAKLAAVRGSPSWPMSATFHDKD